MNARRILSTVAVSALAATGYFVIAPAQSALAAGPPLSAYCQSLFDDRATIVTSSLSTFSIHGVFTAGEALDIRVSGPSDLDVKWTYVAPSFTVYGETGVPADTGVSLDETGVWEIDLAHTGDASVKYRVSCGRPPAITITPTIAGPYYWGEVVPVNWECDGQVHPAVNCYYSDLNMGTPAGDPAGFNVVGQDLLDTSVVGPHHFIVGGDDGVAGVNTSAEFDYTVLPTPQTITFSTAPASAQHGSTPYPVSATSSSGSPVALSVDPSSAGVCAIVGGSVSFVGVGTCTIDGAVAASDHFAAATGSQSITVTKALTTLVASRATVPLLGLLPTTFSAKLTRTDSGVAVVDVPVVFTAPNGGKSTCSAVTDASGVATCSSTVGAVKALLTHTYQATYAGSFVYVGSASTGKLG